jgi:hypothetical protein
MFLWSKRYLTNGIKLYKHVKLLYPIPNNLKRLTKALQFTKKNLLNHNFKKPKIIFSKTSYVKNKIPHLTTYKNKNYTPNLALSLYFNLKNKKVLLLNYNTLNIWFYSPFANLKLFRYTSHMDYFNGVTSSRINKNLTKLTVLGFFMKNKTPIIYLEAVPGKLIQYAKSWNSVAKIINTNFKFLSLLVLLPSRKRKILSLFTRFTRYNKLPLSLNTLYSKNTYTQSKIFNKKSTVRGVAKNPTDHPHGGRTNTIKSPKTPWGYTAKRNK